MLAKYEDAGQKEDRGRSQPGRDAPLRRVRARYGATEPTQFDVAARRRRYGLREAGQPAPGERS